MSSHESWHTFFLFKICGNAVLRHADKRMRFFTRSGKFIWGEGGCVGLSRHAVRKSMLHNSLCRLSTNEHSPSERARHYVSRSLSGKTQLGSFSRPTKMGDFLTAVCIFTFGERGRFFCCLLSDCSIKTNRFRWLYRYPTGNHPLASVVETKWPRKGVTETKSNTVKGSESERKKNQFK